MKAILLVLPLLPLCGCLAPAKAPAVAYWPIEFRDPSAAPPAPRYGVVRLSQVAVAPPYSGERIVVLRRDGTLAFDDRNAFAAPPASLGKYVFLSALKGSGLFADAVGASSGASAAFAAEIVVSRLALDCRQEDSRRAVAAVFVRILKGKTIVATTVGEESVDATDGDFGVAFSKAVSAAVSSALSKLP